LEMEERSWIGGLSTQILPCPKIYKNKYPHHYITWEKEKEDEGNEGEGFSRTDEKNSTLKKKNGVFNWNKNKLKIEFLTEKMKKNFKKWKFDKVN
jgi:hypothetical protein